MIHNKALYKSTYTLLYFIHHIYCSNWEKQKHNKTKAANSTRPYDKCIKC